jgi:hypothetical protein
MKASLISYPPFVATSGNRVVGRPGLWVAILLALTGCGVVGCQTVPKNGAILAGKLTEGIQRNQAETEKIITALADVQRTILSEHWERVYASVESGYRAKSSLAASVTLSDKHRSEIAAVAAKTYYDLRALISVKEEELKSKSRANSRQLTDIGEGLQKYLLSVEQFETTRNAAVSKLTGIVGVDSSSLNGLAKTLIDSASQNP